MDGPVGRILGIAVEVGVAVSSNVGLLEGVAVGNFVGVEKGLMGSDDGFTVMEKEEGYDDVGCIECSGAKVGTLLLIE